jgi:hypothetical protein
MNDTKSAQHDDSQPMSLRERKKRLAQATIEEAALRLFQPWRGRLAAFFLACLLPSVPPSAPRLRAISRFEMMKETILMWKEEGRREYPADRRARYDPLAKKQVSRDRLTFPCFLAVCLPAKKFIPP